MARSNTRIIPFLLLLLLAAVVTGCSSARTISGTGEPSPAGDHRHASVAYRLTANIPTETFHVAATLENIDGDTIAFNFPIWSPGAYDVVGFGRYVEEFTARGIDGRALQTSRAADSSTVFIIGADARTEITYTVRETDSLSGSLWFGLTDIESDYVFANTPAIFGYPVGYKDVPYTLTLTLPPGWEIATGFSSSPTQVSFTARDYDQLVDMPLVMGKLQRLTFTEGGKVHVIAIHAPDTLSETDRSALVETTRKIVRLITGFFDDMPYESYTFQHFLIQPDRGNVVFGALEHANSSTYQMPYAPGQTAELLAPVIAHEFWHLWSPKRFHVAQLGPFDYQSAPRTRSLWFHEGLTEYYANVLLMRARMIDSAQFVDLLEHMINLTRGHLQTRSIAEVSYDIALSDPTGSTSLYTNGQIIGLLMDAAVRLQTNNSRSLDDAMRYFNQRYGRTGTSFTDEEIIPIIEQATGAKLQSFYDRYIIGHETYPYDEYLPKIGFSYVRDTVQQNVFGATLELIKGEGHRVVAITPGGTAAANGLSVGDLLTSIGDEGNTIFTFGEYPEYVADQVAAQIPSGVTLVYRRDGQELRRKIEFRTVPVEVIRLRVDPDASGTARAIREGIFGF